MNEYRFDAVITSPENSHLRIHHCRGWDVDPETNGLRGCYGTNPEHGETFEDAKKELVEYLILQCELEYDDRERWDNDEDLVNKIKELLDYYKNLTYDQWLKDNVYLDDNIKFRGSG